MKKTMCGTTPEKVSQREIVLVPIPFTDLSSKKRRPVLILSRDSYNNNSDDFLAAAITSNLIERPYSVLLDSVQLESGTLPLTSMVRPDKLYALNKK